MSVKPKISKKGKILIIALLVLILGGSGVYLLWRTNQADTTAPTDSEAGQSYNGSCWACCTESEFEYDSNGNKYCPGGSLCGCSVKCGDGVTIRKKCSDSDAKACTNCYHAAPGDDDPVGGVECNIGSQCDNTCYWPEVAYCNGDGTCSCKSGSSNGCTSSTACEPVCPSGYEKCTSNCGTDTKTATCTDRCAGCNNKYTNKITCKRVVTTNVCDGGEWLTKPTGKYKYCDPITYTAKAKDSDGIDKASVVVKLNSVKRTKFTIDDVKTTSLVITEPLSTSTTCLPVGSYTLSMSWKDKKGATSTACSLSTTFKITEVDVPEVNPEWSITKIAAEQCLEDGDAEVIYTISIKNIGEGTGSIDKIVDTLDSKVLASYITGTISEGGLFGSGNITWELEGEAETFAPEQEKTYTYSLIIPKTAFGSYTNIVTATPTAGENFSDSVTVEVDCEQDIPQTGLFDSTVAKIAAGVILLLLGFNLHRVDTSFRRVQNSLNILSISMKDTQSERRKKNFEKKIVKK